jgi:cbb3-type cytochrome oxidase subunit 3
MKYNIFMRKARILLVLGILVAILPYLGFPYSWKDILTTLFGLGFICFSYILYREYKTKENTQASQEKTFDNFSENSDFSENETEIENKGEHVGEEI